MARTKPSGSAVPRCFGRALPISSRCGRGCHAFEALKAHDQLKAAGIATRVVDLYSIVPVDQATLLDCARATGGRFLTVEDHYAHGGIGDAVLSALASEGVRVRKLAVREIPHSGKPGNSLIISELEYVRLSKPQRNRQHRHPLKDLAPRLTPG